jgi:soluble lytic murein transglycosylase-like protein
VDVVSPKGAVGLMQLMPATAERLACARARSVAAKLADPPPMQAGARYLKYLIAMFPGRLDLALAAYNAGENAVKRFGQAIPPYKETQNYVRTVLALYEQLQPGAAAAARGGRQAAIPGTGRVRMELRGDQPAADLSTTPNFLP